MVEFDSELAVASRVPFFATNFIPTHTVQVHASNLLRLPNGDLLCAWFGGSQEGLSDICIYISRLGKEARTWSEPLKISDDAHRSEQNPVLFLNPESRDLWILYTAQPAGNQDKAIVRFRVSKDNGESWTQAENLFNDEGLFIRQPINILHDGTWVLPAWYCRNPPGYRWIGNDDISVVKYSHDNGRTWHEKAVPDSIGAVHMNIKTLNDGTYTAFYRSRWADNIYTSISQNGLDWSVPVPTTLPNPNSGICFDVLPDGRIIIVFNDSNFQSGQAKREGLYDDIISEDDKRVNQPTQAKEAIWGVPRKTLTVGISEDVGRTWTTKVLQEGDGFCMTNNSRSKENQELSYPSISIDGDMINVAFTFWRQRIRFCRFSIAWLDS